MVAAVPSEGGRLALLSPLAEWLATLPDEVPPGNCDCQALGRAGCGGFSSSCLFTSSRERDRDLESLLRRPLDFSFSSPFSAGARLHLSVSAVSPDASIWNVVTFCVGRAAS